MLFLKSLLRGLVKQGSLSVVDASNRRFDFGDGQGPQVTLRIKDPSFPYRVVAKPSLAMGEAYMDGKVEFDDGDIHLFLDLIFRNMGWDTVHWFSDILRFTRRLARRVTQYNPVGRSKANVAHHYDLNGALYELFLDSDRQYSCAYFADPGDDLERAQAQKKRHIAAKLLVEPRHRVLDIGSGWGGMAIYLAQTTGAHVTGVTLSEEQHKVSRQRAEELGLSDRVEFLLRDYRDVKETYDRIVSVGMFEHVGIGHYPKFFGKVRDLLRDDGVALLHTIGRADGPSDTDPWINKYIFPGGYSPALSEVVPVIEDTRLQLTDVEILRLHYAETLKAWRQRFTANREKIRSLYDERFCRMWEFYLSASEATFRYGGHVVFQIQMAKSIDAVPMTRDYIPDWERGDSTHPISASAAE